MKLRREQRNNLRMAILRAKRPGMCQYMFDNGSPCCVIGQLAAIEVGPARARKIFTDDAAKEDIGIDKAVDNLLKSERIRRGLGLRSYPITLLAKLQGEWDSGGRAAKARKVMLSMVETTP